MGTALLCVACSGQGGLTLEQSGDGGSGGSSSSGDAGSSSGSGSGTGGAIGEVVPFPAANLVDDLEDGDGSIKQIGGRRGAWYVYNDGSNAGTQSPASGEYPLQEGGLEGSKYHAMTKGSGYSTWGAGMGFDFNNPSDGCQPSQLPQVYDASGYDGLVFLARGSGSVRVKLLTADVVPLESGGDCSSDCDNAHQRLISLEDQWQQFEVRFDDVAQLSGGADVFDAARLMTMQFQALAGKEFEIAVDDIGFLGETNDAAPGDNTGPSDRTVLSGFRASRYGIEPFPEASWWTSVGDQMATKLGNAQPAGIWILGTYQSDDSCKLDFPSDGGSYSNISFHGSDLGESALDHFDQNGVKVFLQVESGAADMPTLIDLVLERYGHHSSVIGFGIDVEWLDPSDVPGGRQVTDAEAESWLAQVRSYDSSYQLMLKHFDKHRMPECYRDDGLYYVNDSQGETEAALMAEFEEWANSFAPNDVGFQVGYETDKNWWGAYADPPIDLGTNLVQAHKNTAGIFWVDFTVEQVF